MAAIGQDWTLAAYLVVQNHSTSFQHPDRPATTNPA
jgi:hypothetical protein